MINNDTILIFKITFRVISMNKEQLHTFVSLVKGHLGAIFGWASFTPGKSGFSLSFHVSELEILCSAISQNLMHKWAGNALKT